MADVLRLPEVQFFYRRWFFYSLTALACAGLGLIIWKLDDPSALKEIGLWLIGLIAFLALLYMAGPTVTDLARLGAAVKGGAAPPSEPNP